MNSYSYEFKQTLLQKLDTLQFVQTSTETYSDLKLLSQIHPSSNFKIQLEFKIIKQYRKNQPANTWETFWLFWSYISTGDGFKETNYIAFKTNGLEIGKAFKSHEQKFIWTVADPKVKIGVWQKIIFIKSNNNYLIKLNNQIVQTGILIHLFENPGRIGLYSEDAQVHVKNLHFSFY